MKLTGHEKIVPVGGECQAQAASAAAEVLIHTATAANTSGASTTIDDPRTNGRPRTLPQVTHLYYPFVSAVNDPHTASVKWDLNYGRWIILHDDGAAIPLGAQYVVTLVQK